MTAAKIIIDRLVPLRKGRPAQLALPDIKTAGDLLAAQSALVQTLAVGVQDTARRHGLHPQASGSRIWPAGRVKTTSIAG
jgi:hypothetical protein